MAPECLVTAPGLTPGVPSRVARNDHFGNTYRPGPTRCADVDRQTGDKPCAGCTTTKYDTCLVSLVYKYKPLQVDIPAPRLSLTAVA